MCLRRGFWGRVCVFVGFIFEGARRRHEQPTTNQTTNQTKTNNQPNTQTTTQTQPHTHNSLHASGIQVILDVVYNHTAELDDKHPYTISFRGIDAQTYYMVDTAAYVQVRGVWMGVGSVLLLVCVCVGVWVEGWVVVLRRLFGPPSTRSSSPRRRPAPNTPAQTNTPPCPAPPPNTHTHARACSCSTTAGAATR